jgi:hypothetical protein
VSWCHRRQQDGKATSDHESGQRPHRCSIPLNRGHLPWLSAWPASRPASGSTSGLSSHARTVAGIARQAPRTPSRSPGGGHDGLRERYRITPETRLRPSVRATPPRPRDENESARERPRDCSGSQAELIGHSVAKKEQECGHAAQADRRDDPLILHFTSVPVAWHKARRLGHRCFYVCQVVCGGCSSSR